MDTVRLRISYEGDVPRDYQFAQSASIKQVISTVTKDLPWKLSDTVAKRRYLLIVSENNVLLPKHSRLNEIELGTNTHLILREKRSLSVGKTSGLLTVTLAVGSMCPPTYPIVAGLVGSMWLGGGYGGAILYSIGGVAGWIYGENIEH